MMCCNYAPFHKTVLLLVAGLHQSLLNVIDLRNLYSIFKL